MGGGDGCSTCALTSAVEQILNTPIAMQWWKTLAAAAALALLVLAIGARAWNCASAASCKRSCKSVSEVAICSPAPCGSPSCERAIEAVKESSPRLEPGLDSAPLSVVAARQDVPAHSGAVHARVAHAPPTGADRLALLSVLLI